MGATRTRRSGAVSGRPAPVQGDKVRKTLSPRVKQLGNRTLRFTISTGDVDRDGDTINPQGWQLENYRKNPVVLWCHDYRSLPVAKCTSINVRGDALVADAFFAEGAVYPLADSVYEMYLGGFLSAVSVGFLPKRWAWVDEDDRPYGIDFEEAELLEFSCVPVPSNPNALIEARAAGVDFGPLEDWARDVLRTARPTKRLSAANSVDELLRKANTPEGRRQIKQLIADEIDAELRRRGYPVPEEPRILGIPQSEFLAVFEEVFTQELRKAYNQARGRVT